MPTTNANGIELYYEEFGGRSDPAVLLTSGLGAQCIMYDQEIVDGLVAAGFRVVRYDNRDIGLSTHLSGHTVDPAAAFFAAAAGEPVDAPYDLSDMARDSVALLDHLEIERVHLAGVSMGGMISQLIAIEHRERVHSLTSVMSTTGEPAVGTPRPETIVALLATMTEAATREERIANSFGVAKAIGTPSVFDEARARARAAASVDRAYDPDGVARQLVATFASGSRAAGLATLDVPTMVLHGDADPLVDISGGRRTAELVPGAEFRLMADMGHDVPPQYWDRFIAGVVDIASAAQTA